MSARTRLALTLGFLYLWGLLKTLDFPGWWWLLPMVPAFLAGWHGMDAWRNARRLDEQDAAIDRILADLKSGRYGR